MTRQGRRPRSMNGFQRLLHVAAAAGVGVVLVACGAGATGDATTEPTQSPAATTPQTGSDGDPGSEQIGVQDHVTIEVSDP